MTPYGDAPRLGDTIDPRLMAQDFSGFARAGAIKGQTLANLGQNIGDIIKIRGEQKKQDAVDEKFLKQGSEFFKGTPLENAFSVAYQDYTSEDITPRDKRALVSSIKSLIAPSMDAQRLKMEETKMLASMAGPSGPTFRPANQSEIDFYGMPGQVDVATGRFYPVKPNLPLVNIGDSGVAFGSEGLTFTPPPAVGGTSPIGRIPSTPSAGGFDSRGARIPTPPVGGFGMEPVLPGETPQPMPQIPVEGGMPQQAPQVPAVQPAGGQPTAAQLRQAQEAAKGDVPVVEDGRITGATQMPGSIREKEGKLKDLEIQQQTLQLQKMEGDLTEKDKEAVRNAARKLYKSNSGYVAIREINKSLDILEGMDSGSISAILRAGAGFIPATESQTLKRSLATLQNKVAFDLLTNLKESARAGGAVGSLSDPEREAMGATQGSLKVTDDVSVLKQNLKDLRRYYADYIHGTKQQRMDALKEGKITKAQYDAGEVLWNDMAEGKSGDEVRETITPLFSPKQQSVIDKYIDKYNP
tara:strand:+ start:244 stop:1818 length:1575 start_codon:yes stop_codon:yes gene_type:complete